MSIFSKIFGDTNKNYLKKNQPLVDRINSLESNLEKVSDEELEKKTEELKKRLKERETLDILLPDAFALVREAAKRTLNQRHFDVQLVGGIVLHQGRIAEMTTGEGKTLTATLPIYLNALGGKGCHLITVNDYLARRDTVWMGQIYRILGLSVGCLNHEQSFLYDPSYKKPADSAPTAVSAKEAEKDKTRDELGGFYIVEDFLRPCSRKEAYLADITYGTNNEFGFDYLRDNMVYDLASRVQREFNYAIIDEVDSILIDEARTPLIISAPDIESSKWYLDFAKVIPKLNPKSDYSIDEKLKAATLAESGIEKVERILGMSNIYEEKGIKYLHHLEQALRAESLFKRDRDYIVKNGQVIIVDEFTGRLMPGRRWSGGLHQAIEAKEGVSVQAESVTLASITFQNYFRMYAKLAGMTGTAATSGEEFSKVYNLEVVVVPTNKPMIRKNLPDRIYKTKEAKFRAVVKEIKERYKKGQPVLVGTTSIEKNEYLGKLLTREGVFHQILNAKHHEQEGQIIAQAGKLKNVTIATNMAGRGVDIILGGNPAKEEEAEEVKKLGGLYVIGTERHEARRIDNQLRGRSGRQGDHGSSQFFTSLEDDLIRIFGGERIKAIFSRFDFPDDMPIENRMISRVIENAQGKVEGYNFDLRKHLLDYDDVLNRQRTKIYQERRKILEECQASSAKTQILRMVRKRGYLEEDYERKEKEIGEEDMRKVEKIILLRTLDILWMEHLENMEALRDSVRLRAYGQIDPLVAYRTEGRKMFKNLMENFERKVVETIFKLQLRTSNPQQTNGNRQQIVYNRGEAGRNQPKTASRSKPGRNDPCPCGAKRPDGRPVKYKKCHGR